MNLTDKIEAYRVILASGSPRRHELLAGLDFPFEIDTLSNVDESYDPAMASDQVPVFLARQKSVGFHRELKDNEILITADTIVVINGEILGKPKDYNDAFSMLRTLSGNTHTVFTGVCIRSRQKESSFTASTRVTFKELSDEEITYYLNNYKPYDKAGSYGVQEWIGYIAITSIDGSYYNVMGLPIQRLYTELNKFL